MKIFIANIDSISKNPDLYATMLPKHHQARVAKFQNQTRKLQFILGHLMTKYSGKIHTSIAHKDKWVIVAAASNALVGIDIENATIERDFVGAAELVGLPAPKNKNEFYKNFTLAEATYKLGTKPRYHRYMRYGDYIICMTSTRFFDMPRLRKFDVNLFCSSEQE